MLVNLRVTLQTIYSESHISEFTSDLLDHTTSWPLRSQSVKRSLSQSEHNWRRELVQLLLGLVCNEYLIGLLASRVLSDYFNSIPPQLCSNIHSFNGTNRNALFNLLLQSPNNITQLPFLQTSCLYSRENLAQKLNFPQTETVTCAICMVNVVLLVALSIILCWQALCLANGIMLWLFDACIYLSIEKTVPMRTKLRATVISCPGSSNLSFSLSTPRIYRYT